MEPASETVQRGKTIKRYRRGDVEALITAPTTADKLKAAFERLHAAQADLRELKRDLRQGELLLREDVVREMTDRFLKGRGQLLGFANRYGGIFTSLQQYADRAAARVKLLAVLERAGAEITGELCAPFSWEQER